ncbi:MAG TPA: hypothetical protein V6C97_00710, partial [Oculatellaceae cyanobacterium]
MSSLLALHLRSAVESPTLQLPALTSPSSASSTAVFDVRASATEREVLGVSLVSTLGKLALDDIAQKELRAGGCIEMLMAFLRP